MDINEILEKIPELKKFDLEQVKRGIEIELEHKDITKGDQLLTARIALVHLKENPNYYKPLDKYVESEKTNSSQKPRIFYAKHIEKGVVRYEDEDIFIDDDFLKKIMPSFEGCPVYVYHQGVDFSKLQEEADGYISKSFYNPIDGWFWVKFIIVSDKGHEAVSKKWGVSNAYMPTKSEGPGNWHNIEYNRKITDGYYTHLAIVPDPRYEASIIYSPEEFREYNKSKDKEISNSNKNKNGGFIVKLFRRKREEISEIKNQSDLEDIEVEVDGREIKLTEMIEAVRAQDSEKKQKINEDQEVDVGDKKMKISEVISAYKNMCAKKNEDEEKKKELEAKKNAEDEDLKKKEEEEKKNRIKAEEEKINALKNAADKNTEIVTIETPETKESRGQNRYGSSVK
jgi:hypothetical protein